MVIIKQYSNMSTNHFNMFLAILYAIDIYVNLS